MSWSLNKNSEMQAVGGFQVGEQENIFMSWELNTSKYMGIEAPVFKVHLDTTLYISLSGYLFVIFNILWNEWIINLVRKMFSNSVSHSNKLIKPEEWVMETFNL